MQIVKPDIEFVSECLETREHHLAKCARICYASTGDNDAILYNNLWKNGHRSCYRHLSRYFIVTLENIEEDNGLQNLVTSLYSSPYVNIAVIGTTYYISTNEQFIREHSYVYFRLVNYEVAPLIAFRDANFVESGVLRYTFIISTGIDITRELNRTSPNNICEQSTRYVDFNKKVGIRFKKCHWMRITSTYKAFLYKAMCKIDEWFYKISRSKYGLNLKPEDARWCLFLDTYSRAVYTYSFNEWKHILELRYKGTTGKPHPDAYVIAAKLYEWFTLTGYKDAI